jgi:hypothetical protein
VSERMIKAIQHSYLGVFLPNWSERCGLYS